MTYIREIETKVCWKQERTNFHLNWQFPSYQIYSLTTYSAKQRIMIFCNSETNGCFVLDLTSFQLHLGYITQVYIQSQ